jgi:glycosyltransferase involved in cell wall biosynthesis
VPRGEDLPAITIVTPCLDAAGTLPEALESVRSQGYPRLEHLVVDGGSTDGTVELLERAEVTYVSEPDRGLSDAMNKGIAMATGEVVGWLNADDRYEPGALLAVGEALAARPDAEWATGDCRIIDAEGREIRRPITRYKGFFLRHYSYPLHLVQNFVSAPATFARREALREVGPLEERYRYAMDYDLWLRLARRGSPLVLDRCLAAFRMTEGTLSMSGFERQFAEHRDISRRHGDGHRAAVTANTIASGLILLTYRALRRARTARPR